MPAYVVFIREGEIVDQEAMKAYQSFGGEAPPAGMKALAVYGAMETIEGESADGIVILEFPNVEEARNWYYSDSYQQRAPLRCKAAPYRGFIVEGI